MAPHIDQLLRELQPREVLLRHPIKGEPGAFERLVAKMAADRGIPVSWFEPDEGGKSKVYDRDYTMAGAADRIEAFFPTDRIMEGGTAHVVQAGVSKMVPTYAWAVHAWNDIERIGEWEP